MKLFLSLLLLLLLLLYFLSPLRRVFTGTHLKQTMFIRYILLQLFRIYRAIHGTWNVISHVKCLLILYQYSAPNVAVFCSSLFRAFPVCGSGTFWMILKVLFAPNISIITFVFTSHMIIIGSLMLCPAFLNTHCTCLLTYYILASCVREFLNERIQSGT